MERVVLVMRGRDAFKKKLFKILKKKLDLLEMICSWEKEKLD